MTSSVASTLASNPSVELAARTAGDLETSVTTEETVYTSGLHPGGLDDENLIQVSNVSVSQAPITNSSGRGCGRCALIRVVKVCFFPLVGQMWSSAGGRQPASLLMLGGGSESEGEGPPGVHGGKSQLIETSIISSQEEEVELLSHQEQ